MRVGDRWYRTIWLDDDGWSVLIIDQTALPGELVVLRLTEVEQVAEAIRTMRVRGAPLIGVAAAYGVALALRSDPGDEALRGGVGMLAATRPTAVNLHWALERVDRELRRLEPEARGAAAYHLAGAMADEDVATCQRIGEHGERLIRACWEALGHGRPMEVLTHCNAGWLAAVDWGTALAPIYRAHDAGIPLHVWVDETRPRNQGLLTEWELARHGVPRTVVVDNAGGHLMRTGRVDLCLVGTDRTTRTGDVANKIGTYLKALAAAAPERSRLVEYARSWEGRPLWIFVVGSADRIAKLDTIKAGLKRLADPRTTTPAEREELIKTLPVSVWLLHGVHGNEISSSDASLAEAYHLLAARNDAGVDAILANALVIIDPMENPDGRARFIFQNLLGRAAKPDPEPISAEHDEPWPGGR